MAKAKLEELKCIFVQRTGQNGKGTGWYASCEMPDKLRRDVSFQSGDTVKVFDRAASTQLGEIHVLEPARLLQQVEEVCQDVGNSIDGFMRQRPIVMLRHHD